MARVYPSRAGAGADDPTVVETSVIFKPQIKFRGFLVLW